MKQEWVNILRREASSHHMCEENRRALESVDTLEKAISLYKKTIDWALEEGYPSYSVLQKHFSECGQYGVFVDKEFHGELLDDLEVYVFHNCRGPIRTGLNVEKRIIPMMYFSNGCEMTILANENEFCDIPSMVPLYIFGDDNRVFPDRQAESVTWREYTFPSKQ